MIIKKKKRKSSERRGEKGALTWVKRCSKLATAASTIRNKLLLYLHMLALVSSAYSSFKKWRLALLLLLSCAAASLNKVTSSVSYCRRLRHFLPPL